MEQKTSDRLVYWGRPAGTALLGFLLLFYPKTVAGALATALGFVVALIGSAMLISYFFGKGKSFLSLCAGILILIIGYSIIREPAALLSRLGKLIGILLIFNCLKEISSAYPLHGRNLSVVLGISGVVLLFVPLTASVIVSVVLGLIVLGMSCSMFATRLYARQHPAKSSIVDSL